MFGYILKTAGKQRKIVFNFENVFFISRRFGFFFKLFFSMRFGIRKIVFYAFQNLKNYFEIFQNDFWKNTFCPSLVRCWLHGCPLPRFLSLNLGYILCSPPDSPLGNPETSLWVPWHPLLPWIFSLHSKAWCVPQPPYCPWSSSLCQGRPSGPRQVGLIPSWVTQDGKSWDRLPFLVSMVQPCPHGS